jgi:FkbM family methyltransferase
MDIPIVFETLLEDYRFRDLKVTTNKLYFIDIGAQIGSFSLLVANIYKQSNVFSFEPMPENYECILRNIKLNGLSNICPYQLAVGAEKKKAILYFRKNTSGGHSIFPEVSQYLSITKEVPIEIISLEDIFSMNNIPFCNFLKIDCEGTEYDILLNTPKRILNKIEHIVLEYHEKLGNGNKYEIKDLLVSTGFKVIVEPHPGDSMGMIFARNEKFKV